MNAYPKIPKGHRAALTLVSVVTTVAWLSAVLLVFDIDASDALVLAQADAQAQPMPDLNPHGSACDRSVEQDLTACAANTTRLAR